MNQCELQNGLFKQNANYLLPQSLNRPWNINGENWKALVAIHVNFICSYF